MILQNKYSISDPFFPRIFHDIHNKFKKASLPIHLVKWAVRKMKAYIINEPNRSHITCTGFGGRTICLPHGANGDTTVLFPPDIKKQQKG